jgi:hypothetical protein
MGKVSGQYCQALRSGGHFRIINGCGFSSVLWSDLLRSLHSLGPGIRSAFRMVITQFDKKLPFCTSRTNLSPPATVWDSRRWRTYDDEVLAGLSHF